MKLLVCTNFAQPFHTGGSEKIVQQLTENLHKYYGFSCVVFCQHGNRSIIHNNVKVVPVGTLSEESFIDAILEENPDHILIYSDWFFRFPSILRHLDKLRMSKSIAMVGMSKLRSHTNSDLLDLFIKNSKQFRVIVHSEKYIDSNYCNKIGIPFSVIHNGIDFNEFVKTDFDFRKNYNINSEKILLCVSNFFPGKGQEFLVPIINDVYKKYNNFTFVFISSTVSFEPANRLRKLVESNCSKFKLPVIFLNDIPRHDVVQSYFASDIFVCPSQQEVGPIVVLESMAAKKPWVSLGVGHVPDLVGGFVVKSGISNNGFIKYDSEVMKDFSDKIEMLLRDNVLCNSLGMDGFSQINRVYNWDTICKQYRDLFYA